jgi:hypothetical protein
LSLEVFIFFKDEPFRRAFLRFQNWPMVLVASSSQSRSANSAMSSTALKNFIALPIISGTGCQRTRAHGWCVIPEAPTGVSTRFFWQTPGADLWRLKLGALCRILALNSDNYTESFQSWLGRHINGREASLAVKRAEIEP